MKKKLNCSHLWSNSFRTGATGFIEYLSSLWPSGRPRWDINTTLFAFWSKAYLTVSRAATIRCVLVMTPFFIGTLKSTLINSRNVKKIVLKTSCTCKIKVTESKHVCQPEELNRYSICSETFWLKVIGYWWKEQFYTRDLIRYDRLRTAVTTNKK